jgi:hypothetical protein
MIARMDQVYRPIALSGRVPCKVDGSYGAIRAGDRLTSSATPGHAMVQRRPGPSVGIALENWDSPTKGRVMVLVQPGWFGDADGVAAETGASAPEARGGAAAGDVTDALTADRASAAREFGGVVTLDANGQAWVELPRTESAADGAYRYQLTCIGGHAGVYVAEEVRDGAFQIGGGYRGLKVSWQVTRE